ncbi:amidohydrolase family protein [Thermotalea metallivorans]|uniref:amidohydrolase family protein n=1 Tax=Thermotalea metallivorans TaxID=520762 RepID=UPI000837E68D|nr:amidohydrolase family protein [Thermotalea metallivorans]
MEDALKVATSNPARILKLRNKGSLEIGKDADIVLVDRETFTIDTVIARGKSNGAKEGYCSEGNL